MGFRSVAVAVGCGLVLCACQSLKPKPAPVVTVAPPPPVTAPAPTPPPPPAPKLEPPPVKQACVPKTFPKAPKYPDSDAALRDAGGAADRYQLMAAGRVLREHRLAELEKQVDACR